MSDVDMKLEELQKQKDAINKAREIARRVSKLEELELEVRFDGELGPRGSAFEIINSGDLGEGCIVVALGLEVLFKRFKASKTTDADINEFVRPCVVHPTKEKFDEIVERRSGLALRAANALCTLYGVKGEADAGK